MLATAGPLAFPNAPIIVWRIVFISGTAFAIVSALFLGYEYFVISQGLLLGTPHRNDCMWSWLCCVHCVVFLAIFNIETTLSLLKPRQYLNYMLTASQRPILE